MTESMNNKVPYFSLRRVTVIVFVFGLMCLGVNTYLAWREARIREIQEAVRGADWSQLALPMERAARVLELVVVAGTSQERPTKKETPTNDAKNNR